MEQCIDLNSGKNRSGQGVVEYTIMQTVGHELTHYIETNSAKGYAVYKDLVRQTLEARGQDFDALVDQKVRNAEANGISLTRDGAVYEVVADASEMMLKDTKALQQLAQQDKSLAEKVKTFVKDLLSKIRKALGKVGAQHPEAKALMEAEQYVAGLQEAWDAALVEAVETVKTGKTSETGETWNGIPVVNKFELREPVEKKGNLVATHAVSTQNLMRMLDEGTMVGMSLAVAQADSYSSSKFGDNTLVFYASAIDPEANPDNHIFGFDAWTPRRSQTVYTKNESAIQQARDSYVKTLQDSGVDARLVKQLENFFATHLEQQPADWIKTKNGNAQKVFISPVSISGQNSGINALYLLQNGVTAEQINAAYSENTRALIDMFQSSPQLMESLNQFKSEIASDFYENRLFEPGITDANERADSTLFDITVANTPDNALAIMKQKPLTDQGDSTGANGIRRKIPLVYNNLNEVHNDQARLTDDVNAIAESVIDTETALEKFKEEISFGRQSTGKIEGILQNAAANNQSISNTVRALWKAGYIKANKKNVGEVMETIQSFRNGPTDYFEAKLMRKSSFSEVAAAVVRESSTDLISRLKENGFRVLTYDGTLNDRIAKVNSVNEAKFSPRENGKLTQKQYESFGWVRENNVLSKQAYSALMSKYSSIKKKIATAPKTPDGYYVVETGDKFGINNHLVLIKGSETTPVIGDIYTINRDNETQIDVVRRVLYERLERTSALPYQIVAGLGEDGLADVFSRESAASYYSYAEEYAERSAGSGSKGTSGTIAQRNNRGRNAGKSGVKYALRSQTDTTEFQRWFKDSEVVDDEGNPLVVYHTTDSDFTTFDSSFLGSITDSNASDGYLAATAHVGFWFNTQDLTSKMGGGKAMPVYLSSQRMYEVGTLDALTSEIWDAYTDDYDTEDPSVESAADAGESYRRYLESRGYDGIMVTDTEFGGTSYVVFESNQIKSATDNVGTFDPGNPDIRYSPRTETEADLTRQYLESMEITDSMNESEKWLRRCNARCPALSGTSARPSSMRGKSIPNT